MSWTKVKNNDKKKKRKKKKREYVPQDALNPRVCNDMALSDNELEIGN